MSLNDVLALSQKQDSSLDAVRALASQPSATPPARFKTQAYRDAVRKMFTQGMSVDDVAKAHKGWARSAIQNEYEDWAKQPVKHHGPYKFDVASMTPEQVRENNIGYTGPKNPMSFADFLALPVKGLAAAGAYAGEEFLNPGNPGEMPRAPSQAEGSQAAKSYRMAAKSAASDIDKARAVGGTGAIVGASLIPGATAPLLVSGGASLFERDPETGEISAKQVWDQSKFAIVHPIQSWKQDPFNTTMTWILLVDSVKGGLKAGGVGIERMGAVGQSQGLLRASEAALRAGDQAKAAPLFEKATTALHADPSTADLIGRKMVNLSERIEKLTPTPANVVRGVKKASTKIGTWANNALDEEEPGYAPRRVREARAKRKAVNEEVLRSEMGDRRFDEASARGEAAAAPPEKPLFPDDEGGVPPGVNLESPRPANASESQESREQGAGSGGAEAPLAQPKPGVDQRAVNAAVGQAIASGAKTPDEIVIHVRQSIPGADVAHVTVGLTMGEMDGTIAKTGQGWVPADKVETAPAVKPNVDKVLGIGKSTVETAEGKTPSGADLPDPAVDPHAQPPNGILTNERGAWTGNPADGKRNVKIAVAKAIVNVAAEAEHALGMPVIQDAMHKLSDAGILLTPGDRAAMIKISPHYLRGATLTAQLTERGGIIAQESVKQLYQAAQWAKANLDADTPLFEEGSKVTIPLGKASVHQVAESLQCGLGDMIDGTKLSERYRPFWEQVYGATDNKAAIDELIAGHKALDREIGDSAERFGLMSSGSRLDDHLYYIYERHSYNEIKRYLEARYKYLDTQGPSGEHFTANGKVSDILSELEARGFIEAGKPNTQMNLGPWSARQDLTDEAREALGFRSAFDVRLTAGLPSRANALGRAHTAELIATDPELASGIGRPTSAGAAHGEPVSASVAKKFPHLEGMHVDPYTKHFLEGLARPMQRLTTWEKMVRAWKSGKVQSPRFLARNGMFDPVQIYFETGATTEMVSAAKKLMSAAGKKQIMDEAGSIAPWLHKGEKLGDVDRMRREVADTSTFGKVKKYAGIGGEAWAKTREYYKSVTYMIERGRQDTELARRGLRFADLNAAEKKALVESAVQTAENALFDYSQVPQWLDTASRKGILPFGRWPYKAAGKLARNLYDNPQRIYAAMRLKDASSQWVDWTYFIPFLELQQRASQGRLPGLAGKAVDLANTFTPGAAGVATALGYDSFTGKRTFDTRDPLNVQARDYLAALNRFLAPTWTPGLGGGTKGGALYERAKKFAQKPSVHVGLGLAGLDVRDRAKEAQQQKIRRLSILRDLGVEHFTSGGIKSALASEQRRTIERLKAQGASNVEIDNALRDVNEHFRTQLKAATQ